MRLCVCMYAVLVMAGSPCMDLLGIADKSRKNWRRSGPHNTLTEVSHVSNITVSEWEREKERARERERENISLVSPLNWMQVSTHPQLQLAMWNKWCHSHHHRYRCAITRYIVLHCVSDTLQHNAYTHRPKVVYFWWCVNPLKRERKREISWPYFSLISPSPL